MPTSLEVYAFLDRKQDGVFPVFDVEGAVVATIHTSYWNRNFQVDDAAGAPLCSGTPEFMSRTYTVSDARGAPLLTLRSNFWSAKKRTVTVAGGAEYALRGESWPSRDWSVTAPDGSTALSIDSTSSGWSFHPDAFAVRVGDASLSLAHVVGIVQVNRMLLKQARSNA